LATGSAIPDVKAVPIVFHPLLAVGSGHAASAGVSVLALILVVTGIGFWGGAWDFMRLLAG
jgi:hypothetical protein